MKKSICSVLETLLPTPSIRPSPPSTAATTGWSPSVLDLSILGWAGGPAAAECVASYSQFLAG